MPESEIKQILLSVIIVSQIPVVLQKLRYKEHTKMADADDTPLLGEEEG